VEQSDLSGHGDAITDSQAGGAKRCVPFQSYVGMRQALDLPTAEG
tara:strand:- start:1479 stop:1613 length:135 start_codon:yes stop_codon:yes gene_type:complete